MEKFDVLVVGSGSGLEFAKVAADYNRTVALVERGPLGGTVLNGGGISSKQLLYHADVLETVEDADAFHIQNEVTDVAFSDIVRDVTDESDARSEEIRQGLQASPLHELFEGEGRFVDERTVEVTGGDDDGTRVRADTVVVATGARPSIPDADGIETVDYLTSADALQLTEPPEHLVVVGSGYVAAELSHLFGTFGSEVTILSPGPTLLPAVDGEVAATFTERYADRFGVYTGYEPTAASEADGTVTVDARPVAGEAADGGDDPVTVTGDELLVADGRIPNSDTLSLEAAGVETDDHGFVETDEYLQTTADGVWALGDVAGNYLLKHSATHEVAALERNIFGDERRPVDYDAMPFAVFATPEVASVGVREEELERGEYATHTERYDQTALGSAMESDGFVKAIVDRDGTIIGCHIIGPQAATLIQEVVVAMTAGTGTVSDIRESIHVHPALSEVVQQAFSGRFARSVTDFTTDG